MKIKELFKPQIIELTLIDEALTYQDRSFLLENPLSETLAELEKITTFDGISLLTNNYQKIHFQLKPDKKLDLSEQIKWHISNITAQPLEFVEIDYTLFNNNDNEIIGIGGLIEKNALAKIKKSFDQNKTPLANIASLDKQFQFQKSKLSLLAFPRLIARINKIATITLIVAIISSLLLIALLQKNNDELQSKLTIYTSKIKNINEKISLQNQTLANLNQLKINNKLNNSLTNYLISLVEIVPDWIKFKKIEFNNNYLSIELVCIKKEYYLTKFASKLKKLKRTKELLISSTNHDIDQIEALFIIKLKGVKG